METQLQQPQTSPLAIWSLVLSITSLFCCGLLTAIPGIICGHMARSKIRESNGTLTGDGLALAGLIIGYVGAVLFVVISLIGILGVVFGFLDQMG